MTGAGGSGWRAERGLGALGVPKTPSGRDPLNLRAGRQRRGDGVGAAWLGDPQGFGMKFGVRFRMRVPWPR